jgi:hypothetical protein
MTEDVKPWAWVVDWDENQSAVEVTRKLIDEGCVWNERLVGLNRQLLWNLVPLMVLFYAVYLFNLVMLFQEGFRIPWILGLVIMTPFVIKNPLLLLDGYRNYKRNVARRDIWRKRFEILKEKEAEIDRLLSSIEAG